MAFDACMARLVADELKKTAVGAKIEKIYQPTKEEIVISCRCGKQGAKLFFSANPSSSRVCLTKLEKENPVNPPMFCMLLRKHLAGAVVKDIYTYGFERVIEVCFQATDEMGFPCEKFLTTEIMGKYSNVMLLQKENDKKIVLGVVHPVDFSTSSKRQVLPGMAYELPPVQDKKNPLNETEEDFCVSLKNYPPEKPADKFLLDTFLGLAPVVSREIVKNAGNPSSTGMSSPRLLWKAFSDVIQKVSDNCGEPTIVFENKKMIEYSFLPLTQYGKGSECMHFASYSDMFDYYYGKREFEQMMQGKAHDITTIVTGARHKLAKKLPALEKELKECGEAEKYRLYGELITASLYRLKEKADSCEVVNYYSDSLENVVIPLDGKLSASQNADRYYKKYTKLQNARVMLTEQIEKTQKELDYLSTIESSLKFAESENDLTEIRAELAQTGYSKNAGTQKLRNGVRSQPKHFISRHGFDIYVGKNNTQNDYLTLKMSKKSDWWFHVKNNHGSHVLLVCDPDVEPDAVDFTEAAELAAYYSEARDSDNVAVDYTKIKNVKKPSGAVPGYVIYSTNYTAYVTPKEKI